MTQSITRILEHLGLKEVMSDFDRHAYHTYVPEGYVGSDREQRDNVHRMSELVLVHKATGLRLEYLTTESYFGDEVRYRLRSLFIVTTSQRKLDVLDIDFEKQQYTTSEGVFAFTDVNRESLS